jgi:hypothetical protein
MGRKENGNERRSGMIAIGSTVRPASQRSDDIRFALLLTYITLGWMTIEGAASLLLGWASKSLLLEAFGIDSVIELFSAGVLLWRLRVEANGNADETRVEAVERRASKWVGYTLYFLVVLRRFQFGLRPFRSAPRYRHTRKRLGDSNRVGCENWNADSCRL